MNQGFLIPIDAIKFNYFRLAHLGLLAHNIRFQIERMRRKLSSLHTTDFAKFVENFEKEENMPAKNRTDRERKEEERIGKTGER
jgi:hypothetical protein